eukprot:Sdes_comp22995_c0_seq1m21335
MSEYQTSQPSRNYDSSAIVGGNQPAQFQPPMNHNTPQGVPPPGPSTAPIRSNLPPQTQPNYGMPPSFPPASSQPVRTSGSLPMPPYPPSSGNSHQISAPQTASNDIHRVSRPPSFPHGPSVSAPKPAENPQFHPQQAGYIPPNHVASYQQYNNTQPSLPQHPPLHGTSGTSHPHYAASVAPHAPTSNPPLPMNPNFAHPNHPNQTQPPVRPLSGTPSHPSYGNSVPYQQPQHPQPLPNGHIPSSNPNSAPSVYSVPQNPIGTVPIATSSHPTSPRSENDRRRRSRQYPEQFHSVPPQPTAAPNQAPNYFVPGAQAGSP